MPHRARPLPGYLVTRYRGWRATRYAENRSWFMHLAEDGQHPRAMLITCCDSRVTPVELFGADPGEFFIHRNIANLVPPAGTTGDNCCTLAAVDYAVRVLHVAHILVLGHSGCGGVAGCHDMCAGEAPALEAPDSTVGRWLESLRPAYERTREIPDRAARLAEMERQSALISVENLLSYELVREAVASGRLTLHALVFDIASGELLGYDGASGTFRSI